MDQSRPRHPSLKSPLIERPDLQTRGQRTLYGTLTVGFWMFWIYLWVPLLALLAWTLGVQQAYKYMVQLGGYHQVMRVLEAYALVIVALGGALLIWAAYNIYRFRGVEKRSARPGVTEADIGRDLDHDPLSVKRWQGTQRLVVTHDAAGRLVDVSE
jgi:biofilm PGA synthesis protein PgaD